MHFYKVGDQVLPSVTTLVHFLTFDDGLMHWANYMGFKHISINDVRKRSTYFGNLVHTNLRCMVDPDAPDPMKAEDKETGRRLYQSLCNFDQLMSDKSYKTLLTEHTMKSTKLGYAGTVDWVATFDKDYLVLSDFKTSKQPNQNMYIQLGGYYGLLEENNIHVDYAQIIRVNEYEAKIHKIEKKKLKSYYNLFLNLVDIYKEYTLLVGPMYKEEDLIVDAA